jgi:hypothetical protein
MLPQKDQMHSICDEPSAVQVFLMMMCSLKYGVFIFFGAWQTVSLIFVLLLLPETQGVPIERVRALTLAISLLHFALCRALCPFLALHPGRSISSCVRCRLAHTHSRKLLWDA